MRSLSSTRRPGGGDAVVAELAVELVAVVSRTWAVAVERAELLDVAHVGYEHDTRR